MTPRDRRRERQVPLPDAAIQAIAGLALFALLVGVPALALMVTDTLPGRSLSTVVSTGRLDTGAVIQLVSIVFLLLWAWFAVTALDEMWQVVRRRWGRGTVPMAPPPPPAPSPSGLARRLVRTALMSSGALLAPALGASCARPPIAAAVVAEYTEYTEERRSVADRPVAASDEAEPELRSNGRETPYSVATKLGDPMLRDRIIAANRGRRAPDGTTWTSGVFPAGMTIELPEGVSLPRPLRWQEHTVQPDESAFRIATTLATGARVREMADLIIERNTGRPMNDGGVFDDPSLLRAGWVIEIPVVDRRDTPRQRSSLRADAPPSTVVEPLPEVPAAAEPPAAVTPPAVTPAAVPAPAAPAPVVPMPVAVDSLAVAPPSWAPPVPTSVPLPPLAPGVPVTAPVPPAPGAPTGAPLGRSIAAALLLCAGTLGLLRIRRRQQLRSATIDTVVPAPAPELLRTERLLRSLDPVARAVRLDLALRSAGRRLVGSGAHICVAVLSDSGAVTLVLDRAGPAPTAPWSPTRAADRWHLTAEIDDDELADDARPAGQPCPAMCHLGVLVDDARAGLAGDVFVDIEALGVVSLAGPESSTTEIARAMAASLAVSPVGESLDVVTHCLDVGLDAADSRIHPAPTFDRALDTASSMLGPTLAARPGPRTSELRSRGAGGDTWDAVVVVSAATALGPTESAELLRLAEGGRGLGVVVAHRLAGAPAMLEATPTSWVLHPFGLELVPVGLTAERIASVDALLDEATESLPQVPRIVPPLRDAMPPPFVEQPWEFLVRLLGPVAVVTRTGDPVRFDRGRALELVLWLSQHRTGATRTAARTAMWQTDVRDNTFSNIVSDARRALARAVAPPTDQEWIGRTLTESLPLHPLVVTDADLLRIRLDASRQLDHRPAIAVLTPGVELVDGMPFSGTDLLWPDAEGITSSLVVLATAATAELARRHLAVGDAEGVFAATARGLAVLPGHEELIGLRMRAHAARGNLAGVRHEWEFYERALDADRWATSDPSPTLASLRRELLAG